jgi:hypothetical protein
MKKVEIVGLSALLSFSDLQDEKASIIFKYLIRECKFFLLFQDSKYGNSLHLTKEEQ